LITTLSESEVLLNAVVIILIPDAVVTKPTEVVPCSLFLSALIEPASVDEALVSLALSLEAVASVLDELATVLMDGLAAAPVVDGESESADVVAEPLLVASEVPAVVEADPPVAVEPASVEVLDAVPDVPPALAEPAEAVSADVVTEPL
jgi:hypothetical protein